MKLGDVFEWLAGAAFAVAAYLASREVWPALLVAGVVLAYEAQCHASTGVPRLPRLPRPRRPRWLPRRSS